MAGSDATEGQAVWQPGGAEEDSRLREGNRHLHLAYDDDEEEESELPTLSNASERYEFLADVCATSDCYGQRC